MYFHFFLYNPKQEGLYDPGELIQDSKAGKKNRKTKTFIQITIALASLFFFFVCLISLSSPYYLTSISESESLWLPSLYKNKEFAMVMVQKIYQ